jgi:hypothetical protein
MSRGVELHFGDAELWATAGATLLAMGAFALSLFLTYRVVSETGERTVETRLAKLTLWGWRFLRRWKRMPRGRWRAALEP